MNDHHPSRFLVLSGGVRRGEVVVRRAGLRDRLGTQERETSEASTVEAATVEWLDAEGAVIASDQLAVHHTCGFPTGSSTTFSGALDHHPGAASIRVGVEQSVPAVLDAARPPIGLRLRTHPAPGEVIGATADVAWDLDSGAEDPSSAQVSAWLRLSQDPGSPVVPVPLHRHDATATEGVVDLAGYGARDGCVLELWVTAVGSVTTTVVSVGPFSTAPQPPTLVIRSPLDGALLPAGVPVTCDAVVLTGEPDALTDVAVQWTSSIQGILDQGSPASVVLVPGEHELTATYGAGEQLARATVLITVGTP